MIICVKCGHQNADSLNRCEECGAQLPRIAGGVSKEPEPEYVNERVRELQDAAQKALSGEWTPEQLGDYLENILSFFAEREQGIRSIEIPPEAIEDFREELENGFKGIQLFYEGVSCMSQFAEQPDPVFLEEGMELVRQGNDHLNEAMRINRSQRAKFEELYLDSSNMM